MADEAEAAWTRWQVQLGDTVLAEALLDRLSSAGVAVALSGDGPTIRLEIYSQDGLPALAVAALAEIGCEAGKAQILDAAEACGWTGGAIEVAPGLWFHDPEVAVPATASLALVVPPCAAFGDGRHPSTRRLATRLSERDCRGARVLDLGCGTGVLGVLTARRGAALVDLADLDPLAVAAAAACAAANQVSATCLQGDLLDAVDGRGPYDLICANLYADLLLRLLPDPRLLALMPPGAGLLLAGCATRHRDEVAAAIAAGPWRICDAWIDGWWCAWDLERFSR